MIRTRQLVRLYCAADAAPVAALRGVSLRIAAGEFVAILGPSGSGKSTLLHILGCLDAPTSGEYFLHERQVSGLSASERARIRRDELGFVFQQFNLLPRVRVVEQIELPLVYSRARRRRARALGALEAVGMGSLANRRPMELSGGQQQRAAIARALVGRPSLLLADEPTGALDTQTAGDILDLLRHLNRDRRLTIVLVTHDPRVACVADRRVWMRDGRIERDDKCDRATGMNPLNLARLGAQSLATNRLRASLTMLGIVIGIAAVVSLLSIGNGFRAQLSSEIAALGTNVMFVSPAPSTNPPSVLTVSDEQAVRALAGVSATAPERAEPGQVVDGSHTWATRLIGVTPEYAAVRGVRLSVGTWIQPSHADARASVVVFGAAAARQLFGTEPALGRLVKLNAFGRSGGVFRVIGVVQPSRAVTLGVLEDQVYLPLTTMQARLAADTLGDRASVTTINVQVRNEADIDSTAAAITRLLAARRHASTYSVQTQKQLLATIGDVTAGFNAFLIALAGISLVVGGIGIMNIMLVVVAERSREIGIRMAVGATRLDILTQFLTEAILLSTIGGLLGVGLGWLLTAVLGGIEFATPDGGTTRLPAATDAQSVILAVAVASAVGMFFGIYPADRAARLDPVEALRRE